MYHLGWGPVPMLHVDDTSTVHMSYSLNHHKIITTTQYCIDFHNHFYYLQASGAPLLPLALDHLPAVTSPSLPLTTTRQCYLEETNRDAESMTVFL